MNFNLPLLGLEKESFFYFQASHGHDISGNILELVFAVLEKVWKRFEIDQGCWKVLGKKIIIN